MVCETWKLILVIILFGPLRNQIGMVTGRVKRLYLQK